ncbi:hypothetical protein [Mesonia aestuariivivens]|uniref:Cytochrome c n=1 Tax=Mesonia aestuariivivens TaxID=2796128 RepID=A0ABS6W3X5_9FLAO|nr:hypothetical protein [Mesonia aestuariivivens]MBW2962572.1 hypothetical protein [Mesonia aestuariivivens]
MRPYLLYSFAALLFISCNQTKKEKITLKDSENITTPFQLYQMSEMASFMEEMYNAHQLLKREILKGETPDSLSYNLLKLHTAKMTDSAAYDAQYKMMADLFIEYEEKIIAEPEQVKQNYNQAINMCISCHQLKCTGPILRIKKLLIP